MQVLATYIKGAAQALPAAAGRMLAVLLAAALACACVPADAFARTASGDVGIRLEVPASAFVDAGDGTKAADALVGIRLQVPKQAFTDAGSEDTRSADGMIGIRMQVPSQAYVEPGGPGEDTRASEGMLGIRLQVPKQAFVDAGDDTKAAEGLFGIRLQVPSQAFTGDDGEDTRAADGLVGIRLQVPRQAYIEDEDGTSAAEGLVGIRLEVATTHTVTFDPNGGTGGKAVTVLDGATVAEPDPVAATNGERKVEGWYLDAACTQKYDFDKPVFGDFTLFAKWSEEVYDKAGVRLHMMGEGAVLPDASGFEPELGEDGEPGDCLVGEYEVGRGMTLPTPTRTGYEFAGWFAGWSEDGGYAGEPVDYISRHETDPREFWAKWEAVPPADDEYWTVSFDVLGGSPVEPQYVKVGSDGFALRPEVDPVRSGYVFDGWFADAMCMRPFDFASPIEGDTVVYARWKPVSSVGVSYTVTFDSRGGSVVSRQSVREGALATRPAAPVRAGYDFVDWYASDDAAAAVGDEERFDFGSPVRGDTTLYAGWKEKPKLTVTFDAAGGVFEGAGDGGVDVPLIEVKVTEGSVVAPESVPDDPKRAGWQFAGWYLPAVADDGGADGGEGDDASGGEGGTGTGTVGGESVGGSERPSGSEGVVLGEKWDPADKVLADTHLYAGWDLRLDVTLPVSVGFAVDADTRAVTTPDEGTYALKSRTVRDVAVDELALASREAELDGFFSLADASDGWGPALRDTSLSLRAQGGLHAAALALAGMSPADASGEWANSAALDEDERRELTVPAFDYGPRPFEEGWQGGDPSSSLGLKLDMALSGKLGVRTDLDGPRPITHLKLTVSARA